MTSRAVTKARNELIRQDAMQGATTRELSERHALSLQMVCKVLRDAGIKANRKKPPTERALKMASMFRQGITLAKIGEQFGITRERVRQLLKKQGIVGADGGQRFTTRKRSVDKAAVADAKSILKWGVPHAKLTQLRAEGVIQSFKNHVRNAAARGIAFKLTFPQWFAIWQTSGKLDQRGRGKGKYVMSRIKDDGCYEIGNVHIQSAVENSREAVNKWKGAPPKPNRGVFLLYPGTKRPWLAKVAKQTLGRHETEEAAVAARNAYLAANPDALRKIQGRGYAICHDKRRGTTRYQVMVGPRYVGTYKTPEDALEARAAFLNNSFSVVEG